MVVCSSCELTNAGGNLEKLKGTPAPLFILNNFVTVGAGGLRQAAQLVNFKEFLRARADKCAEERNQHINFLAVDFPEIGEVFQVTDALNGVPERAWRCNHLSGWDLTKQFCCPTAHKFSSCSGIWNTCSKDTGECNCDGEWGGFDCSAKVCQSWGNCEAKNQGAMNAVPATLLLVISWLMCGAFIPELSSFVDV